MPRYTVEVVGDKIEVYEIEASSRKEARDKFHEGTLVDTFYGDVTEVEVYEED